MTQFTLRHGLANDGAAIVAASHSKFSQKQTLKALHHAHGYEAATTKVCVCVCVCVCVYVCTLAFTITRPVVSTAVNYQQDGV